MSNYYLFKYKDKQFNRNNISIKINQKMKINNHINDLNNKEKKNINIDKSLVIYDVNSYFNRI